MKKRDHNKDQSRGRLCHYEWRRYGVFACLMLATFLICACEKFYAVQEPAYYEVYEVSGTPYQRGFQHGRHYTDKIHSLYTMLLENSIFPYLNRERGDLAGVMIRYQDEDVYGNGKFCRQMMLESAQSLLGWIPDEYLEEMRGIADGSGMSFDDILILNTFFDTLMGFRSLTFYIKLIQGPTLLAAQFLGGLGEDGIDNDGDGVIDEHGEGALDPFEPDFLASMTEVPTDAKIRFVIDDQVNGADPKSIRIQLDNKLYLSGDDSITTAPVAREGKTIEAIFTPPGGLPPASVVSLTLQAADLNKYENLPPYHPRSMRDQRITFTTRGYGLRPSQVPNRGWPDGRTQPPSVGFAVRGSVTKNGEIFLAHHMALLDSNITHKHVLLLVQRPDNGKPFLTLGYTGIVWGFSGMNADGLAYVFNTSDTLNNSFTAAFNRGLIFARLQPTGVPVGLMGRELLRGANVGDALNYLSSSPSTFGWNFLLADKSGRMEAVELDGDILKDGSGGFHAYDADPNNPNNRDPYGNMLASIGPDDLRIASHYQKNRDEIDYSIATFHVQPQRFWSSFWLRSLKAFYVLGEQIQTHLKGLDLKGVASILRDGELVDQRDSMNAAIYEPQKLKVHVAAGHVPATDGPFRAYDLAAFVENGGGR